MNERKNAVHASLVAEHQWLLQDHNQVRSMAAAQAAEIRGLRGEASSCRFFSSFLLLFLLLMLKLRLDFGAAAVQADPADRKSVV